VAQLVVGLGNPGPAHAGTRHNAGQAVVARLAERLGVPFRPAAGARVATAVWQGAPLHLAVPGAFVNVAGPSVAHLLGALGLTPDALVVVHDDLDLPFGRVRIRRRGGHGGHNGMRSVLGALGTEAIRRVKVGIGRPPAGAGTASRAAVVDWVLGAFEPAEGAALPEVLERAADAVLAVLGEVAEAPA
jgi:PTH1 family peptidyl-tRNA hydrolase